MKRLMMAVRVTLLAVIIFWLAISVALAQVGGYDLSWFTVDGGSGTASSGNYTLNGTVGQADAGVMSNGGYTMTGGFWNEGAIQFNIYMPLIRK